MTRVYLDWNATAPLRPEARAAMLEAMDVVGNPSSVHTEGRAAKAIIEKARAQVARLVGCEPSEVVFTSGATEANSYIAQHAGDFVQLSSLEHDSINVVADALNADGEDVTWVEQGGPRPVDPDTFAKGLNFDSKPPLKGETLALMDSLLSGIDSTVADLAGIEETSRGPVSSWWHDGYADELGCYALATCIAACGETGICQVPYRAFRQVQRQKGLVLHSDVTQLAGRQKFDFDAVNIQAATLSGHKIGGTKGAGALVLQQGVNLRPLGIQSGGGQEMGRRSGTENVIGIAGFGAAAEAAERDLEAGVWERVETLRDRMEAALEEVASDIIFFGRDVARLPNTSCFAVPGWKGETQVMQMDLAGYAVSAGSACSSGKVKESRVLRAMGFDSLTASSAIRVSMGPTTTEDEVMGFAKVWADHYRRWKDRRAA